MSLHVVTPPTAEPVSLAEVRAHARIDSTAEDPLLAGYIMAAREMAEHELQCSLAAKTYELTLDEFPAGAIELPMGPIPAVGALSVTSVKYTDTAGAEQTVAGGDYTLDPYSLVPSITPVSGWPSPKVTPGAVRVRYVSGPADQSAVPVGVKVWLWLHVAEFVRSREANADTPLTPLPFLGRLLDPYRTFR